MESSFHCPHGVEVCEGLFGPVGLNVDTSAAEPLIRRRTVKYPQYSLQSKEKQPLRLSVNVAGRSSSPSGR